jgi:predicted KAP-like P-loop ATPase
MNNFFISGECSDPGYRNVRDAEHGPLVEGRLFTESLWARYGALADSHFREDARAHFIERFWEMYLGVAFLDRGYQVSPGSGAGPEFSFNDGGRQFWVEAVAPGPGTGPDRVPKAEISVAGDVPTEKILLRFANAVAAKREQYQAALKSGIVSPTSGYLLAINSRRIPHAPYGNTLPFYVQALLPLPPRSLFLTMDWLDKLLGLSGSLGGGPIPESNGEAGDHGASNRGTAPMPVRGDNPVRYTDDDTLSRSRLAKSLAEQVLAMDSTQGLVVGVLGPWGSGKTSLVNLAKIEFERLGVPILDFNPWMFSGAQQLVESFFIELAAQLKVRPDLAEVGKGLEEYGETFSGLAWLPVVGPWIDRARGATKLLAQILQRRKEGVGGRRRKLEEALGKLEMPILVVLDDVDRLSTAEIRDVFKLVRLTASFPKVIYIVAFDRHRVESALAEQGIPGRDYLEKILQVAVDIPPVPRALLDRQIFAAVDGALAGISDPGPFDQNAWPDLFAEIVRPLVRSMRDVRRYAMAVRGTVSALGGYVALADVLALESIRVFMPDVFALLHASLEGLTTTSSDFSRRNDPPQLKTQVDELIRVAEARSEVVQSMISRLFPAASRHLPRGSHFGSDWLAKWLTTRRVAHEDILRLYLERVEGDSLRAFLDAESAWRHLGDRAALEAQLRSLDAERLQDVIASLEVYQDQFAPEHVVPATIVLMNLLPELPKRTRGMFELDTTMVVTRVTYRLFRSLKDPVAVEEAVRDILPQLTTLSSKFSVITQVGHREGAGGEFVPDEVDRALLSAWRDEVRGAPVEQLAREWDLLRVLYSSLVEAEPAEPPLDIAETPEMTLVLLRASRSETKRQAFDSRAVRRSVRLNWDALAELCGGEDGLRRRVEAVKTAGTVNEEDATLVRLAERYVAGWKPSEFRDDDE